MTDSVGFPCPYYAVLTPDQFAELHGKTVGHDVVIYSNPLIAPGAVLVSVEPLWPDAMTYAGDATLTVEVEL